jgi:AcrR family transcriptional regulator
LGTRIEDIAKEAGVGVATVYRQFGSREGLLDAYARERSPRVHWQQQDESWKVAPIEEVLCELGFSVVRHLRSQGRLLFSLFSSDEESRKLSAHLHELERQGRQELLCYFEEQRERGVVFGEARRLAEVFLGMMLSFVLFREPAFRAGEEAREADVSAEQEERREVRALVSLFLKGCLCERSREEAIPD